MRRAAAVLIVLCAWPSAAAAADDYPICTGDTSAAAVAQKPGQALRVGITPRVEAGQFGKDSYGADIRPTKRGNVAETCTYPDSEPTTQTVKVSAGNLLVTGSKRFKIGGAMKGRYSYFDDYLNATTVWNWSLKPRR